jgi:hypothetical protein
VLDPQGQGIIHHLHLQPFLAPGRWHWIIPPGRCLKLFHEPVRRPGHRLTAQTHPLDSETRKQAIARAIKTVEGKFICAIRFLFENNSGRGGAVRFRFQDAHQAVARFHRFGVGHTEDHSLLGGDHATGRSRIGRPRYLWTSQVQPEGENDREQTEEPQGPQRNSLRATKSKPKNHAAVGRGYAPAGSVFR